MSLNFPNVSVLGLSRTARFFDAGFLYSSFKRITIEGVLLDLANDFGVTGIWTGERGVLATIRNNQNYQPLILNGVNFGSGRIENINFSAGLDVQTKNYRADLLIFDSGNLFNFTGQYYSGIQTDNFQYLQSFSENYSFEKKLNGGYGYSHDASIQFSSGVGNLYSIGAAQSLAKTLFTGSNLGFAFYPGFTDKQGKRYVTENYNLISNECSFQERFDFDNNNGNYSATQTVSIELDEQGVVSATENGNIRGIENPNYQKALSALNIELTGSYLRCSGAASYYFPTGAILLTNPVSQGRSIDIFNNNINYSVSYDNSINNRPGYFWDYSLNVSKQDGVSSVTEQGEIIGRGENPSSSFALAQQGLGVVKSGIANRCGAMFVGSYAPSTNYLFNKQETYSPAKGQAGYSYQYSNDPTLVSNSGIRKKDLSINNDAPVYIFNQIGILNFKTILQHDKQGTQGAQSVSVVMEGDKTVGLTDFISSGLVDIYANKPTGIDIYVGDINYTYDVNINTANINWVWRYNKYVQPTTYPVS